MIDISDNGVDDGAESLIVSDVCCSGSSGLDDDRERERLGAYVVVEFDLLANSIVGEDEVVGCKFADVFSGFSFDLHGHLYEHRAHGKRGSRVLSLLGDGENGGRDQR